MGKVTAKGTLTLTQKGQLRDGVRKEVAKKIKSSYLRVQGAINDAARDLVKRQLMASSVTQSILSGKLRSDFGLSPSTASSAVKEIVDYVSDNVRVVFKAAKGDSMGFLTLELLPMGVDKLSAISAGSYTSGGKFGGGEVSWLDWLLTRGTQVVIGDFWVFEDPKGRTRGGSVMQKNTQGRTGFRIEPGFSGTENDNFVTRALAPILPQLRDTIFKTVKGALK
jgi:hypothetical protein